MTTPPIVFVAAKAIPIRDSVLKPESAGRAPVESCPHCGKPLGQAAAKIVVGDLELDFWAKTIARSGKPAVRLSAQIFLLMEVFMRNPGRVLVRHQIQEAAWEFKPVTQSNSVDVAICSLRRLIGPGVWTINTRKGLGYILEGPGGA